MNEGAPLGRALIALGAPTWRDRKAAVDAVSSALASAAAEESAQAVDQLLELVLSPELEPRAGARDVLVRHPSLSRPALRRQIDEGPEQRALVEILSEVADDQDTERLVEHLDPLRYGTNMRAAAAAGLGRIGNARAIEALVTLLQDPSETLRVGALEALRESGAAVDPALIRPLLASSTSRRAATVVVGQSRSVDAIAPLVDLLGDAMASVRAAAALALARLDHELDAAGHTYVVGVELARADERRKQHLRGLLEHRVPAVRDAAMRLCALAGDVAAVDLLFDVADDPTAVDRGVAMVSAFGASANAVLRTAAARLAPAQREQLFRLIGALPVGRVDPYLLERLTSGLGEESEDASVAAAEALALVGDRTSLAPLYRAMAHDGRLGESAADALAAVLGRGANSAEDLSLVVGSPWPTVAALARNLCRVAGALRSARWNPWLIALLGSAEAAVRVAAALALGGVPGDQQGADALAFALADEEPLVRAAACRSLGQLAVPLAVQPLLCATHDRAPQVRAAAASALVMLDNPVALPRLRAMVAEDSAPAVVVHAIAGLGRSPAEQDLTMLMSLSLSADHEVAKAAARALATFTHSHRATAALLGLLGHLRWDVRWSAAQALLRGRDRTALQPLLQSHENERDPLVRQAIADAVAELGGPLSPERR